MAYTVVELVVAAAHNLQHAVFGLFVLVNICARLLFVGVEKVLHAKEHMTTQDLEHEHVTSFVVTLRVYGDF
jgi:hypothetical protein